MPSDVSRRHLLKGAAFAGGLGLHNLVGTAEAAQNCTERGTGDLGIVIERADQSILIIETTAQTVLGRVEGMGDLSHASCVFSRDERYAYIFGRDGGLTKVDMLSRQIVNRVVQSGNSIGGAISQDGRFVAVSNYTPGGVKVFDSQSLELVKDIPTGSAERSSKVVGLVDAPGNKFLFSLYDDGDIWSADMTDPTDIGISKIKNVGELPYDALITPDGRYYVAGLFGEDGLAMVDLWKRPDQAQRILNDYGKGDKKLPVYKMPHLEGWAEAGGNLFVPAVGHHEVLIVNKETWTENGRISVHGQPIFVMARPDGRHVWINFALPNNDTVQVIDALDHKVIKTLKPGRAILHMEFTPRGEHIWVSSRDDHHIAVYDTNTFEIVKTLPAKSPSGIFFTSRAHQTGL